MSMNPTYKILTLVLAPTVFSLSAAAFPLSLTFEGLNDGEAVLEFYNGGTGSAGSIGPNVGVSFSASAQAFIFGSLAPSPVTVLQFAGGSGFLNIPGGADATEGFSFYYGAADGPVTVTLYSDEDGGGSVLATLNLDPSIFPLPLFDIAGVFTSQTVKSVFFSGPEGTLYDTVTFGGQVLPEPGSASLMLAGGALLLLVRRRTRTRFFVAA